MSTDKNSYIINEDKTRENTALFLTLAVFFFNHNCKKFQEDFHNDFHKSKEN